MRYQFDIQCHAGGDVHDQNIIIRTLWLFVVLFIVGTVVFYASQMTMMAFFGQRAPFFEIFARTRRLYSDYLGGILSEWDWGATGNPGFKTPVWQTIRETAPYALRLNLVAMAVSIVLALFFGITTAWKKNTVYDYVVNTFCLVLSSIPAFIWIFGLMVLFGFRLRWVPPLFPLYSGAEWHVIALGYVIPTLALIGMPLAVLTQLIRGELSEQLDADFLLLAKVKGLRKDQIVSKHLLRNSILPALEKVPVLFASVMFNSFLLELIYGVPGVGRWFFRNIYEPMMDTGYFLIDVNVMVAVSLFYAVLALAMILIVDVLYVIIDPRIALGDNKEQ